MHQIFNEYYEAILALFDVGMTTSKLAGWAVSYLCIGQIDASTCPPGHTPGI